MLNSTLTERGFVPLDERLHRAGYQIFIKPAALKYLEDILLNDYLSLNVIRIIFGLRSTPQPLHGLVHKRDATKRRLLVENLFIDYFVESGCVCIIKITHNPIHDEKNEIPGLHIVQKEGKRGGRWKIVYKFINTVETEYAAVNGQSNDRDKAIDLMPQHIIAAYGKDAEEEITEYTLFHNPTESTMLDTFESARDKFGLTNPITKDFAKILNKTQLAGKKIKWLTHSQGGAIFSEAVRYHTNTIGSHLNNHTVYYNSTAANMFRTKYIMKKAGVNLHKDGYNNSGIDFVPQVVGLNGFTDIFNRPSFKSLVRLGLTVSVVPVVLGLATTEMGPAISVHTTPNPGALNYAKRAGSAVAMNAGNASIAAAKHAGTAAKHAGTAGVAAARSIGTAVHGWVSKFV